MRHPFLDDRYIFATSGGQFLLTETRLRKSKRGDRDSSELGVNWAFVEKGGEARAGEWTTAKEERLRQFVDYGHRLGYLVSFYCLDGYSESENQGWDKEYSFGSGDAVRIRWNALIRAHADFISTDQYEMVASLIRMAR